MWAEAAGGLPWPPSVDPRPFPVGPGSVYSGLPAPHITAVYDVDPRPSILSTAQEQAMRAALSPANR